MKKREIIVVRKLNMEQIEQKFHKIGDDFKTYKKDWSFSVTQNKNMYTIHAYNKVRFISVNYHSMDQSAKSMKISVIESEDKLLLEKEFSYSSTHFILVKCIPNLTYFFLIVNSLWMLISYIQRIELDGWHRFAEFFLVIAAIGWYYINFGSEKLEKDRYIVIEEVLKRIIYD